MIQYIWWSRTLFKVKWKQKLQKADVNWCLNKLEIKLSTLVELIIHKVYFGHLLRLQFFEFAIFRSFPKCLRDTEILYSSFLLIPSFSSIIIYWKFQNVKEGRNVYGRLAALFEGNIIFFIVALNLFSVRNPFDVLKFIANHDSWCARDIINIYLISEHWRHYANWLHTYLFYTPYIVWYFHYTLRPFWAAPWRVHIETRLTYTRLCFIAIYGK